jgi:hypothetical protein
MTITAPATENGHLDRAIECQSALELAFENFAERAVAAGWSSSEVALALTNLSRLNLRRIAAVNR